MTRYRRNALGQTLEETVETAEGNRITRNQFNARGQLESMTTAADSPLEAKVTFDYDGRGYQTRVTDPQGRITRRDYNARGQLETLIYGEDLPPSEQARETYQYDGENRLKSVTDSLGRRDEFILDDAGRPKLYQRKDNRWDRPPSNSVHQV